MGYTPFNLHTAYTKYVFHKNLQWSFSLPQNNIVCSIIISGGSCSKETIPVAWTYAYDYSFSNNSNNVTF